MLQVVKNNYYTVKVFCPHVVVRHLGLLQDLPLLGLISLNRGSLKKELLDKKSLDRVKFLSSYLLDRCFAYRFSLYSGVINTFAS